MTVPTSVALIDLLPREGSAFSLLIPARAKGNWGQIPIQDNPFSGAQQQSTKLGSDPNWPCRESHGSMITLALLGLTK